ncbi:MAG TPA: RlpA-like double-psi beta-barrel domain-containing protein [Actinomycetota bacterium]|nr:RlpA-like double-psi beta-barrel domain-containing protein [Actinomycetota bacterium]
MRTHRAIMGTTVVAGLVLLVGVVNLSLRKHVNLVVDGERQTVATTSNSVQDLLADEGLTLTSAVLVQPSPTSSIADGMTVVVNPARVASGAGAFLAASAPNVTRAAPAVFESPTDVGVWVMAGTSTIAVDPTDLLVESDFSASSVGTSPAVPVQVVVLGKVRDVLTNAGTTGELLSAMGIKPDADDRVRPSPETPLHAGTTVAFDAVRVVTSIEAITIPFDVQTEFTPRMTPGTPVKVLQEGRDGRGVGTFQLTRVNGEIESRRLIGRWIEREPVTERRLSPPESMYAGTTDVPGAEGNLQTGHATWYDPPWSGLTAAHPTLPFGTLVTVTDDETGRSVTVTINDRGPFGPGRVIDLSPEAFAVLQPLGAGVLDVQLSW